MYKNLWLRNKTIYNLKGSLCSLLFILISFYAEAQLPQKWYLGNGKLIDFTQEPLTIKDSKVKSSFIPKRTVFQFKTNNKEWLFTRNNAYKIVDDSLEQITTLFGKNISGMSFSDQADGVLVSTLLDSIFVFNFKTETISSFNLKKIVTSTNLPINIIDWVKIQKIDLQNHQLLVNAETTIWKKTLFLIKEINGKWEMADFSYIEPIDTIRKGISIDILLNDYSEFSLCLVSFNSIDRKIKSASYLMKLSTKDSLRLEILKNLETVPRSMYKDGSAVNYYDLTVGYPFYACKSSNDSFIYVLSHNLKIETDLLFGKFIYTNVWDGSIKAVKYSFPVFVPIDSVSLQFANYRGYSRFDSGIENFQMASNSEYIFNVDHVDSHKSYLMILSDKIHSKMKIRSVLIDNSLSNDDYDAYYVPNISSDSYKKLHFLRAKQCTDELRLFADADSFYQEFEWHVANDSGGFDILKGKNLRYPSKGKRVFYVKIKGIAKSGYYAWYSDTISFNTKPKASFNIDTSQWCQWVGLQLKNTSFSEGAIKERFTWQLVQNDTIKKTYSIKNPFLTFNSNGSFDIRLIYSDGVCTDTLTQKAAINIIPAPKPQFNVIDSVICENDSIIVIDRAIGKVTKRKFTWSDGYETTLKRHSRYFEKTGQYKITQTLTGPTGCVTKDSNWVRIRPSFTKNDSTQLLFATVLDSQQVLLKWKTNPIGLGYFISHFDTNGISRTIKIYNPLQDSIIDTVTTSTNVERHQYLLQMMDSCENVSQLSNLASTILLQVKNDNNTYIVLNWNPYETWQKGILSYEIERSFDKITWQNINSIQNTTYQDDLIKQGNKKVFYRIKAIEKEGNQEQSTSNVVETSLQNSLFAPNAFSPNGDGINDVFKVGFFGFKSFECSVYSSSGQIVAFSHNPDAIWDGTFNGIDYPIGTYK